VAHKIADADLGPFAKALATLAPHDFMREIMVVWAEKTGPPDVGGLTLEGAPIQKD
jgi:hypothetical protein